MDDLTAFITARLDEDEELAQDTARGNPGPWSLDHAWIRSAKGETVVMDEYRWGGSAFTHIGRHDPARVLREVAAKRAIASTGARLAEVNDKAIRIIGEGILMDLAAVWPDHPDYRQEWAV